jgi:3-hydroxybutyrate dehydrogenase
LNATTRVKAIFSSSLRWTYRRNAGPFTVATDWAACSSFTPESLDTLTTQDIELQRAELAARHGAKVLYSPADMNAPSDIQCMVKEALQGFGDVDVLVNNAGIQFVSPIDEFPDEKWEEIIRVDLVSCFYTIKGVLPAMKARGWGRIINIASGHGLVASPNKSAYVAAKHGLVGLTKTVALETAQFGVTVNAICPGYLKTAMVEKQIRDIAKARNLSEDEAARDVILAAQPTKRFVTVEQIAAMVLFLCRPCPAFSFEAFEREKAGECLKT